MAQPGKTRRLILLAGTLLTAPCGLAQAQSADGAAARMNSIEAQIRSLQGELRAVRRDLVARDAQVRAARQEAAQARAAARSEPGSRTGPPTATANAGQFGGATLPPLSGGLGGNAGPGDTRRGGETTGQQEASTTPNPTPNGTIRLGGVTVTLGGFAELAGIYRSRNEVSDIASNFNTGIPTSNLAPNHEGEFRGSARQSRISLLAEGKISDAEKLAAYFETDFQGGSPTANQNESNSYNLRLRVGYGTYDNSDLGLHVLAGQSWSLLTQQQVGITPRKEDIPLTIDAQYVVGFNWARQPQLRVVKDFDDHKFWAGLSLEQPQNVVYVGPNGAGTLGGGVPNYQNPGAGILASTVNYSDDIAPDVIAKLAYDPGFGHFEINGIARFLHDRVSVPGNGHNHIVLAGGGGIAANIPILDGKVSFRGSVLAGYGLGRYASGQLPDSTLSQSGSPVPLPELSALIGVVAHPVPTVDLYSYVGTEQVARRSFTEAGKGYGYGSSLYPNAGCYTELSTAGCTANTSGLVEGTLGAWWRVLHGNYGTAQVGAQYAYVRRDIFSGTVPRGTNGNHGVDENIAMVSFRYLPFQ